ncbi:hypothetical protein ElyMa_005616300 [Elysia marginata]|uniref:Reverse transcriptase domain-containing protein n=1 Tax=Elysia marginata TaxID=1093978 RepID=A0AAV4F5U0_9GAST|nr:hypothetical protein ElyMa_005616300 [Elysia marginata]
MAETPESLQQMLDSIAESCKTYGMEINAKKTKTMHIGKEKKKKSLENILEGAQDQRRGTISGGCNRKTARPADKHEIALRWSCHKRELGTSFAASLGSLKAELSAEEVEDALKGAGLATSSNGLTIVHMDTPNGKLRVERNGESWLPTFGPKKALNIYKYHNDGGRCRKSVVKFLCNGPM